jgi:zinc protease
MSLGFGLGADLETVQELPDRIVSRAKVKMLGKTVAEFSSGYDGTVGWSLTKEEGLRRLEGAELQQMILDSRLDRELRLHELYPIRKALPPQSIDGRSHEVLEMSTLFGSSEVWYFDAGSGLLTRTERVKDDPKKGKLQVTSTFRDYREVDGVRIPFRTDVQEGKDKFTIKIKSVTHNVPLDAGTFTKPD